MRVAMPPDGPGPGFCGAVLGNKTFFGTFFPLGRRVRPRELMSSLCRLAPSPRPADRSESADPEEGKCPWLRHGRGSAADGASPAALRQYQANRQEPAVGRDFWFGKRLYQQGTDTIHAHHWKMQTRYL